MDGINGGDAYGNVGILAARGTASEHPYASSLVSDSAAGDAAVDDYIVYRKKLQELDGSSNNLTNTGSAGDDDQTPCQACCAPGGDCSRAFKGVPGICCGIISDSGYCCPLPGYGYPPAQCNRKSPYEFTCAIERKNRGNNSGDAADGYSISWFWMLILIALPVGLCYFCFKGASSSRAESPELFQQQPYGGGTSPAYGQYPNGAQYTYPVASPIYPGAPPYQQPHQQTYGYAGGAPYNSYPQQQQQQQQGGYGMGSVAAAGGAGLLGGVLLGNAMDGGGIFGGGGNAFDVGGGDGGGDFGDAGGDDFACDM